MGLSNLLTDYKLPKLKSFTKSESFSPTLRNAPFTKLGNIAPVLYTEASSASFNSDPKVLGSFIADCSDQNRACGLAVASKDTSASWTMSPYPWKNRPKTRKLGKPEQILNPLNLQPPWSPPPNRRREPNSDCRPSSHLSTQVPKN